MSTPSPLPAGCREVYLSVGGNIGKALENCRRGIARLGREEGVRLQAVSSYYRTAPVDYEDQAWFVNAAVHLETRLDPMTLLACLQVIQKEMGRGPDKIRFGPRILDLDIIFYGDLVMETPQLCLPHPRMHQRRFVLQPLCEINPEFLHPRLMKTVRKLLQQLPDETQEMERLTNDF